jgi:hypothetical protein
LSGGLPCASAAVAEIASAAAKMPVTVLFMKASLVGCRIVCGFEFCSGAIMPHGTHSGKARPKADFAAFSAKRNDRRRMGRAQRNPSILARAA